MPNVNVYGFFLTMTKKMSGRQTVAWMARLRNQTDIMKSNAQGSKKQSKTLVNCQIALEDQNRVVCTPTSTTAISVVARGGIVVALVETFGGSSSLRLVLY
ncbi:hypothetical protein EYF80_038979 [Liparis tanakae]|uniref:Uncharacterized protein n=1 Tax=Liparis tanakae TaxID=230148 RepID=A0A4Z2GDT1_9TELE|nr:hypothetical protein EYF80_038979 [Liparis tanakae]